MSKVVGMRISSVGKIVAAVALVGSLSFPAFAVQKNQAVGCTFGESGCVESESVPEPGMLGLLGLGLAGLIIARRRK